ncbi:type II secretion system F family protein [Streptomyces sp. NPDC001663]|uniref:type II secretion system F family protein n=1 Tax=Streptomyces sp. NPDC001663 TaxID=3364597 RepID=UPI0036918178
MNADAISAALLGLGVGLGLLLVVRGWRGPAAGRCLFRREQGGRLGRRLAVSLGAGFLCGALTGWVAGGAIAALATWSVPALIGLGTLDQQRLARVEGMAAWTEMLRDTLAAAAGLEQAISATADAAPEAIRPQVLELSARLKSGEGLGAAARLLAHELAEPTADLVLATLVLSSQNPARHLAPLLGELAATARAQVAMELRVDAARARTRTTVRVVVITSLTFAFGLVLLNRQFLEPYDTALGQLVLVLIGGLFGTGFHWLRRLARFDVTDRFFGHVEGMTNDSIGGRSQSREVRR